MDLKQLGAKKHKPLTKISDTRSRNSSCSRLSASPQRSSGRPSSIKLIGRRPSGAREDKLVNDPDRMQQILAVRDKIPSVFKKLSHYRIDSNFLKRYD